MITIRFLFCAFSSLSAAAPPNKKRAWSWPAYLEEEKAVAAPVKLFKEVLFLVKHSSVLFIYIAWIRCHPINSLVWTNLIEDRIVPLPFTNVWFLNLQHQSFPQSRNSFKVGMKLEGLDPCHPSLFCVLTVAEVCVQVTCVSFGSAQRCTCTPPIE